MAYVVAVAMIGVVTAMMHHIFATSGVDTILEGLTAGLGLGAFVIAPWLILLGALEARGWRRILRTATGVTLVCGVIGAVLIPLS
ncbi:DUF1761 domain-containing protein [Salipiger sp. IMCC34102]|uniref:DUF1761 domain-containing protein n=1 Tax=Salipiger sp. IMCC34102 TaxID=2510647 RepID=UPI0013EB21A3|nr:DUF1761 domain-containing protein [Salipiger sp. IMCC34102]